MQGISSVLWRQPKFLTKQEEGVSLTTTPPSSFSSLRATFSIPEKRVNIQGHAFELYSHISYWRPIFCFRKSMIILLIFLEEDIHPSSKGIQEDLKDPAFGHRQ